MPSPTQTGTSHCGSLFSVLCSEFWSAFLPFSSSTTDNERTRMNSREKMDVERSLGEQEKRTRPQQRRVSPKWRDVFRLQRIDPVLSPKRESQLLLQWDGKILPSRNGARGKST